MQRLILELLIQGDKGIKGIMQLSKRHCWQIDIGNTLKYTIQMQKTQIQIYKNTNINENQGGSQQGNNAIIQKTLLADRYQDVSPKL